MKASKKSIALTLGVFLAPGCVLTDDRKQDLVDDHLKNTLVMVDKEKVRRLEADIREIKELTPKLMRFVKMEQELSYILETIKTSQTQVATVQGEQAVMPALQENIASVIKNKRQTQQNANDNTINTPAPVTVSLQNSSEVLLASAPPITVALEPAIKSSGSIDKKFSSIQGTNSALEDKFAANNSSASNKSVTNDKFSIVGELPTNNRVSSNNPASSISNNKCNSNVDTNGTVSIHLASYSTTQSAQKGWQSLSQKHEDTLCGLKAVLADVTVKGKQYKSLRVGPLANPNVAGNLCQKIRAQGDYCVQSQFVGTTL